MTKSEQKGVKIHMALEAIIKSGLKKTQLNFYKGGEKNASLFDLGNLALLKCTMISESIKYFYKCHVDKKCP